MAAPDREQMELQMELQQVNQQISQQTQMHNMEVCNSQACPSATPLPDCATRYFSSSFIYFF